MVGGVLLLLFSGFARAQEEESEDLEVELFFAPAETVTIAARHAQPLEHSPAAITVLTREDIRTSGARSLPEVLRLVPGMDIGVVSPFWYSVGVRAGTIQAGDNVLLLVDGRDMTMEFLGAPFWTLLPGSMDDIERIEVIRGPGSALYGANAYAGVVNVVTTPAGEGPRARACVRGGEDGVVEMSARVTEQLGALALGAGAGLVQVPMWTDPQDTGMENVRGWLGAKIDLGEETSLLVEAGAHQTAGNFTLLLGEVNLHDMRNVFVRVRFEHEDLMVQANYDWMDFRGDMGLTLYYPDLGIVLGEVPLVDGITDKFELEAQQAFTAWFNRITFGGEYVSSEAYSDDLVTPEHDQHRFGLFAQDEIELDELIDELWEVKIPPLMMTAGLRFDATYIGELGWKYVELSPRASLVMALSDNHSIRCGYAHAFLKPSFMQTSLHLRVKDINNLGFEHLDLSNPDLEPQIVDSLDLGWSGSFLDGRLIARLDLAYNWYRKRIWFNADMTKMNFRSVGGILVPNIEDLGIGNENDPSGDNGHNLEVQVILHPTDNSRLFAQAGYRQVFEEKTGLFSRREPVLKAAAGGDLKGASGWMLSLRAFYTSSYEKPLATAAGALAPVKQVRLPAVFFLNFRFSYELAIAPVRVSAGVEAFNLLNARFREYAGRSIPNRSDYGGELLGRRIVLFLRGEM